MQPVNEVEGRHDDPRSHRRCRDVHCHRVFRVHDYARNAVDVNGDPVGCVECAGRKRQSCSHLSCFYCARACCRRRRIP
jgi:hypothetical protein